MIYQLFTRASEKAGGQEQLGNMLGIPQSRVSEFKNYKGKGRKPSDIMIGELAEYIGLDPLEVILLCKIETDKENEELWKKWFIGGGALGGNRTHDPRLRRSEAVNQTIKYLITLIITTIQLPNIARNQDERSALCYQYHHALVNL